MTWEEFWEVNIGKEWKHSLPFLSNYADLIMKISQTDVYPEKKDIFKAFRLTPPSELKVCILGQDPYPQKGKATGLAFANFNEDSSAVSPSLKVIWNHIEREFYNGFMLDFDFSLESWAKQGVLLLNTALTVEPGKAGSHISLWNDFTTDVIKAINYNNKDVIFILWGKYAEQYSSYCNNVLKYVHPAYSLYSHTKWLCPNFKEANDILLEQGKPIIKW